MGCGGCGWFDGVKVCLGLLDDADVDGDAEGVVSVKRAEIVTFMQLETYFCASVTTTTLPTTTRSLYTFELVHVYLKLQYGKYFGEFRYSFPL